IVATDRRDPTPEPTHGLSELETNKAAAENDQMLRNTVEFQGFDVRQGICFPESGSSIDCRMSSCVDDHAFPLQQADLVIGGFDLNCFWRHKSSRTHDQLGSALLVEIQMHVHQAGNHFALALTYRRHVDFRAVLLDSKFLTSSQVRSNLRGMDDILARKAGDVGA